VISAFKPRQNFEKRFLSQAGENLESLFIEEFLSNLPVKAIIERTEKMLYSKMIAYYIQRGYEIRYDAKSFYSLLNQNFALMKMAFGLQLISLIHIWNIRKD
jgi:hypothetical protein